MSGSNLDMFLSSLPYESKCWNESDTFGKVQWLDLMYKNKLEEIESLEERLFELQDILKKKDMEIDYLRSLL